MSARNDAGQLPTARDPEVEAADAAPPSVPLSGDAGRVGQTVSHYRILELLGAGAMGTVYRAEDLRLCRPVALKFLPLYLLDDEQARDRFRREAQAASALDHPNVCVIHEIDETSSGELFIAMGYCAGESLRQRLERGPLPVQMAVGVACQIAQGLALAHEYGIIHRDIKPDNVKASGDGTWKLLDFGIAKLTGQARLTGTGTALGTLAYMAPEQAGDGAPSPQSDIWSLGVMLYEMLTGRLPFHGTSMIATLYQILHTEPPPVRHWRADVPTALERIVSRALAKDLRARYGSVRELLPDLTAVGANCPAITADDVSLVARDDHVSPRLTTQPPFLAFEGVSTSELTLPPFVGRVTELTVLDDWLHEAARGHGRVGFVTGETGTGKTALAREAWRRAMVRDPELVVAVGRCTAHTGIGDPYHPFREALALLTGDVEAPWAGGSLTADHATRLWRVSPLAIDALVASGPDLLGTFVAPAAIAARTQEHPAVRDSGSVRLHQLLQRKTTSQSLQQADLFEQYWGVLRTIAKERPVLLVLDDLQWADPGSIGLLFHLGRQLQGTRILMLGLYRPSEVALGRRGKRHPLEPVLNELKQLFGAMEIGLDQGEGRAFLDALIDSEPNRLGEDFRAALFRQTQGHALFTVELLRDLKERGALVRRNGAGWVEASQLDWATLPARIEAVLSERIGRLGEELHHLLTVAAVEGERFTLEAVADVVGQPISRLIGVASRELEKRHRLVVAEGVERVNGRRFSTYRFRHILFQRHLYDRLDAVERSNLHERVGTALEALYAEHRDRIAIRLARHFQKAGLPERSVPYLRTAADFAARSSAYLETTALLREALATLDTVPQSPARDRQELELLVTLGGALMNVADVRDQATFERAFALAKTVGDERLRFMAINNLYHVKGHYGADLRAGRELGAECLALARAMGEPGLIALALDAVARNAMMRGNFVAACRCYEELLAGSAPGASWAAWPVEASPVVRGTAALNQWMLGFPERALADMHAAQALNQTANDLWTRLLLRCYEGWLHMWRRDLARAEAAGVAVLDAVMHDQGLSAYFAPLALPIIGWCKSQRGALPEGDADVREAIDRWAKSSVRILPIWFSPQRAEVMVRAGHLTEALAMLDDVHAGIPHSESTLHDAENLRLRGDIHLGSDPPAPDLAEAAYRGAIDVARRQSARMYELRATTSLARLPRTQSRTAEARTMLADIYRWFTEGFDTADLVEAKELLDELGPDGTTWSR